MCPSPLKRLYTAWTILISAIAGVASGQEITLVVQGPSQPVKAGTSTPLWLNALNPTDHEALWSFPPSVRCLISLGNESFERELPISDIAGTNRVSIRPGAFERRQYWLELPRQAVGPLVLEFPELNTTPLALKAELPLAPKTSRAFGVSGMRKNAEPAAPGKPFDPGRYFKEQLSGYEPFYFIAGPDSPTAKFQISFKYQLLSNQGSLAEKAPLLKGFHFAYTQTSLWDLAKESAPFLDSSYKPELFYAWSPGYQSRSFRLDLQSGAQHESNGKGGSDSRSLNILYLRPTLTFGKEDGLQLTLQPRAWVYVGDMSDNPDLARYRGYADLRATVGLERGLQLSALGRLGNHADRGSIQLDLTYPMMRIWSNFSVYLQVQYFNGYGESLLQYNQRSSTVRAGIALFR